MCRMVVAVGLLVLALGLLTPPGCRKCPSTGPEPAPAADSAAAKASAEAAETWDLYRMQGKRIGYGHTTIRRQSEAGRSLVVTESLNHLSLKRGDETSRQDIRTASVETPDGRLIRFESEIRMGPSPIRTTGRVEGDRLALETAGVGTAVQKSLISWTADYRGPFAVEQSLRRRPMQPGERRTLKSLMVGFNQAADVELTAKNVEPTELLDDVRELLRIETVTRLPDGQKLDGTIWTDPSGDALKTYTRAMDMETLRVSKAVALAEADAAELDLLPSMLVKIDRPLPNPHQTKQVRYRVRLDSEDPARALTVGPSQAVESLDPHAAEVAVFAIRPGDSAGNAEAPDDPPTDDDRRPNHFIQSDDPTIASDARRVAAGQTDPWRVAAALEQYVHREVKEKNFSQAFATAAEVARSREGDCTEHAVLLAALCRARGIPARVAVGLVYMPSAQAFGYHMWTEVYIDNRWIPIDGTLGLGGIGAAHLKIAQSNLAGASAYSAFLPVAQLLGHLKIEILEINP